MALDDGAYVAHYYFKRGAFSQQQLKHFIHITPYSILNIHQVFMLIEIAKIQLCHHVTTHSHELLSIVSINCVNNVIVIGVDYIA